MRGNTLQEFTDAMRAPHLDADRRERGAVGCALILVAGWSALFAALILAAVRWLVIH